MAGFGVGVTIMRPVEDVFAVLSNFSNESTWASGVTEPAKKTSDGPIGVGTTWHVVGKALGRKVDSVVTFTEFEPNRKIVYTYTKPFPTTSTVVFESIATGTRVRWTYVVEHGRFFKLLEPLAVTIVRRQLQNDLDNLRNLMDAHAI